MTIRRNAVLAVAIGLSIIVSLPAQAWGWGDAARYASHEYEHHESAAGNPGAESMTLNNVTITTAFSPDGQCQNIIVDAINQAQKQILVQAYSFSNKYILKALVEAKQRGIDVRVILDKSNETQKYSGATYVANAGIPTFIDYKPAIAHNKVMIIDHAKVVTGSFNFSAAAQTKNAENVAIIGNAPQLADFYIKDWNWRLSESRPYVGKQ